MTLRCCAALLFFPVFAMGGVIATASSLDGNCGSQSNAGEFTAVASIVCSGSLASGGASLTLGDPAAYYGLQVSGSKDTGVPSVQAVAKFDDLLMVNGGGASGFLLVRFDWQRTLTIVSPSRIQGVDGNFLGDYFYAGDPPPLYVYVPFTAGVPVHVFGTLHGFAGSNDRFDTRGEFDSTLTVYFRVTSQMVADPMNENPMYVAGASVTAIPEPRVWMLVVTGLAAVRLCRGRRASCG